MPAPEIDWNYAVIERLDKNTLKTSLIPFDLGKLVMDHDPSQNLELQPGDIVSIFSQADIHVPIAQQTKFVRLEGEFVHAGTYSVKPGETLPELIARAGGFTTDAYLYGSEFSRESTRVIQQQRIDEYVQNLQLEINRGTLAQSSSAASSAQDVANASAAARDRREPDHQAAADSRNWPHCPRGKSRQHRRCGPSALQLEDGDRFIVPSRPASVNVVGSVYDQNSFLLFRIASRRRLSPSRRRTQPRCRQEACLRHPGRRFSSQPRRRKRSLGNTFDPSASIQAIRSRSGEDLRTFRSARFS